MSDWHVFGGQVVPMEWGDSTYTVLPIPQDVAHALKAEGAKRVEGELGDYPVNLALTKAPVIDGLFVYTGKTLLRDAGIQPGEIIDVRLRAADPNLVETPQDVVAALHAAGKSEDWAAITPGKQRGLLHQVNTAKRADTRTRRIASLVENLP